MCLATVYKESDDTVICRNVSKILVEDEKSYYPRYHGRRDQHRRKDPDGRSRKQHCKITVRLMIRS